MTPALALGALLLGDDAHANPVTTTFCFQFSLAFDDGAVGDQLTGTYMTAHGVKVKFINEFTATTEWEGYTSGGGGCIVMDGTNGTVQLDDATDYTVQLPREARIGYPSPNTVVVRSASGGSITAQPKSGLRPSSGHTYSYANGDYWTRLAATDPSHILAAAAYTLYRTDPWPAVASETIELRDAGCGGTGAGSCYNENSELIWIAEPRRKFVTSYMVGQAIVHSANGHDWPVMSGSAVLDACVPNEAQSGHKINTKEYQGYSIIYGYARFIAAATFNDGGADADCEYGVVNEVDWSADGDAFETDEDEVFSCSGSPAPGQSPAINASNYFDQKCFGSGTFINRATVYDWLKTWWDYYTDSAYGGAAISTLAQLGGNQGGSLEFLIDADPDTWEATGDLGGDPDHPWERLEDVMDTITYPGDLGELMQRHGAYH